MQISRKDTKVLGVVFTNKMALHTTMPICLEALKPKDPTVSDLLLTIETTGTLTEADGIGNIHIIRIVQVMVGSISFQSLLMSMQTVQRILELEKKPLTLSATLDKQTPLIRVTFSRLTYLSLTSQLTNPEEPTSHALKTLLPDSLQASASLLH